MTCRRKEPGISNHDIDYVQTEWFGPRTLRIKNDSHVHFDNPYDDNNQNNTEL